MVDVKEFWNDVKVISLLAFFISVATFSGSATAIKVMGLAPAKCSCGANCQCDANCCCKVAK